MQQEPEAEQQQQENNQGNDIQQIPDKVVILKPKKCDFRMHAHVNPLNETLFPYPLNYKMVDWSLHYPAKFQKDPLKLYLNTLEHPISYSEQVESKYSDSIVDFIDIGCGFGGLCFALSEHFPNKYTFGMEIRGKVVNFVGEKIRALRNEGTCQNVSVIRSNAMRHLPQYFRKGSIEKIFICFPDPHFKKKNFRRRIVNPGLLSEYAYLLKKGGRLYCITDVEDLHNWHVEHIVQHKMVRHFEYFLSQDKYKKKMRHQNQFGIPLKKVRKQREIKDRNLQQFLKEFEVNIQNLQMSNIIDQLETVKSLSTSHSRTEFKQCINQVPLKVLTSTKSKSSQKFTPIINKIMNRYKRTSTPQLFHVRQEPQKIITEQQIKIPKQKIPFKALENNINLFNNKENLSQNQQKKQSKGKIIKQNQQQQQQPFIKRKSQLSLQLEQLINFQKMKENLLHFNKTSTATNQQKDIAYFEINLEDLK